VRQTGQEDCVHTYLGRYAPRSDALITHITFRSGTESVTDRHTSRETHISRDTHIKREREREREKERENERKRVGDARPLHVRQLLLVVFLR
jgi:hypothetical protein